VTQPARVLFVAPSAYPLGGVQTWLDYLLPGLARRGWQPVLGLVSGRLHDVPRYVQVHPGHEYIAIENPTGTREGRIRALVQAIRRVQPQLIVAVNICDCYAAVERMRFDGESAPHIAMADHSVEPDFLKDAAAWQHVLDAFIGTNQLTVRLARDYAKLDPKRVHYAPYGVPVTACPTGDEQTSTGPLRIAYAGRLDDAQKRAQDIAPILDRLESLGVDYRLRIAGGGPYLNTLREQLRGRIEDGRVQLLGVLDCAALDEQLYAWSQVVLLTSSWETGPIVAWEAMARHRALVSARYLGSGAEGALQSDENCLLFPVGDVQAAADQLRRTSDSAVRRQLTLNAHTLVKNRYSRDRSVAAWDTCLRDVLARPCLSAARSCAGHVPSGRLDRWLGSAGGETLRRWMGRAYRHEEPGGEWPHSEHCLSPAQEQAFWDLARRADRS
jgi:glycosyltransferase involved in cell wall biosynthesis